MASLHRSAVRGRDHLRHGRVRDAVVWSLETGHSRRMHIEDREHERSLRELVCDLAANANLHDLSSAMEQGEIWVAFDHD
jgi:hypothetical protein